MKKLVVLAAVLVLVAAGVAQAGVAGSKHDLSVAGGVYTGGTASVCQFCHAPHNASNVAGAPLWNKTLNAAGFTLYTGNAHPAAALNARSLACLSCHDGRANVGDVIPGNGNTGATLNSFGTPTNGTTVTATGQIAATSRANLGVNLQSTHPISVTYTDAAPNSAGLAAAPATGIFAAGWRLYGAVGNWTVECSSCHQPHNATLGAGSSKFLRGAMGTICGDCHSQM